MIQSKPGHNLGDQQMTYRMAANAIWNKLNFTLSLLSLPLVNARQIRSLIVEAQSLADSIVHDEHSGDDPAKVESEFRKAAILADDLAHENGHLKGELQ